ncbi:MAG: hypothetical protein WA672_19015 [Candidatus Angelobacter sp.]
MQQGIKAIVAAEFTSQQAALLQEVEKSITDALKANQRALVLTEEPKNERKSHKWDVAQIIITALVGLAVWYTQNTLSDKITATNQAISTSYVLTQEYYKERFKVYQQTYERLAAVEVAFRDLQQDASLTQPAISAKEQLDEQLSHAELYFSPDILKQLNDLSYLASQIPPVNPSGSATVGELMTKLESVKQSMYKEVTSGDIGSLPASKK